MTGTLRRRNLKIRHKGVSDRENRLKTFDVRDGKGAIVERWTLKKIEDEIEHWQVEGYDDVDTL